MSLQLILGGSGTGKSYYLYQEMIRRSLESPNTNFIIIVPEQFTMQTQKDLVAMHPKKGIMNIDILSFQRLAYHVFDEVGGGDRLILEETGKSLVIRKVAQEKQAELQLLGSSLKKLGYVSEIKSVISELTQYAVTPEQLSGLISATKGKAQLNYKLQDIQVLYEGFREFLEGRYITAEEVLEVLCTVIDRSETIRNSVIALDGFTGFTPIQNQLLCRLLVHAGRVMATVTVDIKEKPYLVESEHKLFHMSKKMIRGLLNMAKEMQVPVEEDIQIGGSSSYRFLNAPALLWLEQNLFRYNGNKYTYEQDAFSIHAVKNPTEELDFTARKICGLIRDHGYRYLDIAVVTGSIETYGNHVEKVFEKYKIPCFVDDKRSVLQNPMIEFIRSLIEMAELDYSYESVFRHLRCGLSGLKREQIDELENYVLALGIRGFRKWKKPWLRLAGGMDEEALPAINAVRERFMEDLISLTPVLKDKKIPVKDTVLSLYGFLCKREIQLQMKRYEDYFKSHGEPALSKEYAQIYKIVLDLLDKVVDLLGEETLTLKEFKDILDAGFSEAKVGVIPPNMDQVVVGDIERTRLKDIRALFFVGVNDGTVPKKNGSGGILSEMDREVLIKNRVELAPTSKQNSYIQKFYLYLNMTKPGERLFMSYSKVDNQGKSLRPSYLIGHMAKMFPLLSVADEDEETAGPDKIETPESGLSSLIQGFRDYKNGKGEPWWQELYSWYVKEEFWGPRVKKLAEASFYMHTDQRLSRAVARALYGSMPESSVTRLEKFAACAFAHFLTYGLELNQRLIYSFAPVDMGNIFHKVLESFSKKISRSGYTWFDVPEDMREQLLDECIEESITDYGNTILYSTARNAYMIDRIRRIMRRTVWALQEQIRKGKFIPGNYEVSFSMTDHLEAVNIMLSDDEKLKLRGRIDRMDLCEQEDFVYVKVIDYKSGSTSFDLAALYYGLQLQLVVYMNAAVELQGKTHPGREVIPAGIFYYHIQDPIVDKEEGEEQNIGEQILGRLRMSGLVSDDKEVVELLDGTTAGKSAVLPVAFNKDGSFSKNSSVASRGQFHILSGFVNSKMKEIGNRILDGAIEVSPYEMGDRSACDYCEFAPVCGLDSKTPGYEIRRLNTCKAEDIWKKLEEEMKHGNSLD